MDVTLLGHDAKYLPLPQGLKELSSDITREVLRCQPTEIYRFIADYVNAVLMTREKAREAAIIVKDILEHDVTYEAMLLRRGISLEVANRAATIIQAAYRGYMARKLFIGRAWLTAGFDLLAYLRARGLDPTSAAVYVTRIQAAYRGHVVRKIMRNTFNYAVGRERSEEKGKELAFYLVNQGVDEEDAHDILENVLYKYGEFAGEYTTEEETETETDASEVEATPKEEGEGGSLTKVGSQMPTSSSLPKVVSSSAQPPAGERKSISPAQGERKSISEAQGERKSISEAQGERKSISEAQGERKSISEAQGERKSISEAQGERKSISEAQGERKSISEAQGERKSISAAEGSPPKVESVPEVAEEGSPPKAESPPGTAEETAGGDGPQADGEEASKTEEAPALEESVPAAEEPAPEAAPEEPAEAPAEAPAESAEEPAAE